MLHQYSRPFLGAVYLDESAVDAIGNLHSIGNIHQHPHQSSVREDKGYLTLFFAAAESTAGDSNMATRRPFALRDYDSPSTSAHSSSLRMRGGRLAARPSTPTPTPRRGEAPLPRLPPPEDVQTYEKKPLPALPGRRHSLTSTLSREMTRAFATPHTSAVFLTADNNNESEKNETRLISERERQLSSTDSNDTILGGGVESEISVLLEHRTAAAATRNSGLREKQQPPEPPKQQYMLNGGRMSSSPTPPPRPAQGEILSPQPKSSVQKLLRLTSSTGGGSNRNSRAKSPALIYPTAAVANTQPSGHNSMHKIKQLMGVDVASIDSKHSSLEPMAVSPLNDSSPPDQAVSDNGADEEDYNDNDSIFRGTSAAAPQDNTDISARGYDSRDSPIPAPLVVIKRSSPVSIGVEEGRTPSSSSAHAHTQVPQHEYEEEDLYHETAAQLAAALSSSTWVRQRRRSGTGGGGSVGPPNTNTRRHHYLNITNSNINNSAATTTNHETRDSRGRSSFGSGSQLIRNHSNDKYHTQKQGWPEIQLKDQHNKWRSSPGLPASRSPSLPTAVDTSVGGRKRATSTGTTSSSFGGILEQRWQSWQQRSQQPQQVGGYQQQRANLPHPGTKVIIPHCDPHPGTRIVLPCELEELEKGGGGSPTSPRQHSRRESIVSKVLKRISGSSTTPTPTPKRTSEYESSPTATSNNNIFLPPPPPQQQQHQQKQEWQVPSNIPASSPTVASGRGSGEGGLSAATQKTNELLLAAAAGTGGGGVKESGGNRDKAEAEKRREDLKSRIRVLDDGGQVLGGGGSEASSLHPHHHPVPEKKKTEVDDGVEDSGEGDYSRYRRDSDPGSPPSSGAEENRAEAEDKAFALRTVRRPPVPPRSPARPMSGPIFVGKGGIVGAGPRPSQGGGGEEEVQTWV
ncbi:hypothetical protein B0H66DRAFT_1723 [Apodospora peruviana]|uniref:Uncharacterized protein n=1 Tax=Apodospora peruviana TaxID=516989 RepID=A0AAE0IQS1_9PEZI|nr:hypothetical protein B0H66DRAFT_1723 [Apodospora peruviana]